MTLSQKRASIDLAQAMADYARLTLIFDHCHATRRRPPSLRAIAEQAGLSPAHLQLLLARWAGLTPEAFLHTITKGHARQLLQDPDSAPAGEACCKAAPTDMHVVTAATHPEAFKASQVTLAYGFHPSPFGEALLVCAPHGLAGLGFADAGDRAAALKDMRGRWRQARFVEDQPGTAALAARIFDRARWRPDEPLRLFLIGTEFEIDVWKTLLTIPLGRATTYSTLAQQVGRPKAARAVGAAVGKNPVSFVVPCHRVLGRSGDLTGYHWGLSRKQALIGWEAGQLLVAAPAAPV